MKVIKTGQAKTISKVDQDLPVLQGFWELEEQFHIRKNPMHVLPDEIPELKPVPMTLEEIDRMTRL